MLQVLEHRGYSGTIHFSAEDECFYGKIDLSTEDVWLYEGKTLEQIQKAFEEAVDEYIAACKADEAYGDMYQHTDVFGEGKEE